MIERTDVDTLFNGELLDDDDGSTLTVSGDLIYGDFGAGNTNTDTVQDTTGDELTEVLARDLHRSTNLFVPLA